jgi:N-glycosylase/DNA lyase
MLTSTSQVCIINATLEHKCIYKGKQMTEQHRAIVAAYETYISENDKFVTKGVKASAARARKALQEMSKGIKERRKEITAEKEALATAAK